ncbi:MAG TPA: type II secretion system protein [bacterium]|nr:type II secretion system protein [bacterium]HPP11915.1 type II secretion system protein [bacterium]
MKERKRGFTLVELLVVIAIIVILALLLMPTLSLSREKARRTVCVNNLRQFAMAFEMYADDWYEKFPANKEGLYDADGSPQTRSIYPDYIKSSRIFWCPSSKNRRLKPPTGEIGQYHTSEPDGNDWSGYENDWYASYAFVFGLSPGNKKNSPVPLVSDRGVYNTSLSDGTSIETGNHAWGINSLYLDGSVQWVVLQQVEFSADNLVGNVACRAVKWYYQKHGYYDYSILVAADDDTGNNRTTWGEE